MLGSEILEIAIGVVFTFLLLSLTASTVRESAEGLLKTRAIQLERGLREMLDDPRGLGVTKQLFDHPLLYGLFPGGYDPATQLTGFIIPRALVAATGNGIAQKAQRIAFRSNLPAYIPSRNVALALLDLASKKGGAAVLSLDAVRQTAVTLQNERLSNALLVAVAEGEGDLDRTRTSLEAWFDSTMDRVSGWYKRETQWILLGIGLVLAVALNVDCLHVARSLALNNTLRQKIVQTVESQQATLAAPAPTNTAQPVAKAPILPPEQVEAQLAGLSDIIGWPQFDRSIDADVAKDRGTGWWRDWAWRVLLSVPGWLISALAVSLGAPFWFDILNKLMVVRSTVKPYEKSPSEGSDDRKPGIAAATLLAPQPANVVHGGPPPKAPSIDPYAPPAAVAIRLAFDVAPADITALELVVDGCTQVVPPDYQAEFAVAANRPHTLAATATAKDGTALVWSSSITPDLDDDGWPMLAVLAPRVVS